MTSKLNQVDMKTICSRQFKVAFMCVSSQTKWKFPIYKNALQNGALGIWRFSTQFRFRNVDIFSWLTRFRALFYFFFFLVFLLCNYFTPFTQFYTLQTISSTNSSSTPIYSDRFENTEPHTNHNQMTNDFILIWLSTCHTFYSILKAVVLFYFPGYIAVFSKTDVFNRLENWKLIWYTITHQKTHMIYMWCSYNYICIIKRICFFRFFFAWYE